MLNSDRPAVWLQAITLARMATLILNFFNAWLPYYYSSFLIPDVPENL